MPAHQRWLLRRFVEAVREKDVRVAVRVHHAAAGGARCTDQEIQARYRQGPSKPCTGRSIAGEELVPLRIAGTRVEELILRALIDGADRRGPRRYTAYCRLWPPSCRNRPIAAVFGDLDLRLHPDAVIALLKHIRFALDRSGVQLIS